MHKPSLFDKTAVVGGASQGIGRAAAMALARRGASIIALSRAEKALAELIEELPSTGIKQNHRYYPVDFEDLDALDQIAKSIAGEGHVHILVNNSGGPPGGPLMEAKTKDFLKAMTRHLFAFHTMAKNFVPGMIKAGYGRIINVISTSVKAPIDGLGVSNTTRGAVASWGKTLASELGRFDITVNNVLPGATLTGRLEALISQWAINRGLTPEQLANNMKSQIPAGRFGTPEEIADVIAFLAGPEAAYINGVNLPVDGGRTKCM